MAKKTFKSLKYLKQKRKVGFMSRKGTNVLNTRRAKCRKHLISFMRYRKVAKH